MPHSNGRRTFLKGAGTVIGVGGLTSMAGCLGDDTTRYVFGAGSEGSGTFATGQAIQSVIRDHSDEIDVTAQTTGGTMANMRQFDAGEVDFFGSSNYAGVSAQIGREPFDDDGGVETLPYQGWRDTVANNFMVARTDTDIESYDDLVGMNVWPLWEDAGLRLTTEVALEEIGIMDEIDEVALDPPDLAGALEEGSVDAAVIYGIDSRSIPGWVTEVDARVDLKHVPMNDAERDAIDGVDVPGRMQLDPVDMGFDNNLQDVGEIDAWTDPFQIFLGDHIPNEDAYEIIDVLYEHADQVEEVDDGSFHYGDPERLAETTVESLGVHPGVAEWYEDQGVWDDAWSTEHSDS